MGSKSTSATSLLFLIAVHAAVVLSAPFRRNTYNYLQPLANGDALFELGNRSYIANVVNPKAIATITLSTAASWYNGSLPLTIINTDAALITQDVLQGVVASYLQGDD